VFSQPLFVVFASEILDVAEYLIEFHGIRNAGHLEGFAAVCASDSSFDGLTEAPFSGEALAVVELLTEDATDCDLLCTGVLLAVVEDVLSV
jgi:hypothetical protein